MRRKEKLVVGKVYHIYNKSIADFKIFNKDSEFLKMRNTIRYYQIENMPLAFFHFVEMGKVKKEDFNEHFISVSQGKEKLA